MFCTRIAGETGLVSSEVQYLPSHHTYVRSEVQIPLQNQLAISLSKGDMFWLARILQRLPEAIKTVGQFLCISTDTVQ